MSGRTLGADHRDRSDPDTGGHWQQRQRWKCASFPHTSWPVRAYYRVWQRVAYVQKSMIGVGIYALSEEGRRRFDGFPSIVADDGYIRRLFKPHERLCVEECRSIVTAPSLLWGLIRIKTRSRRGGYELSEMFPELSQNELKDHVRAFLGLARRPALWPALMVYVGVNLIARLRCTVAVLTASGSETIQVGGKGFGHVVERGNPSWANQVGI